MITYNSDHDLIDRTVHPKDKRKVATANIFVHRLEGDPHEFKTSTICADTNPLIMEEVERIGRSLVDALRPLDDNPREVHFTYQINFWGNDSNGY